VLIQPNPIVTTAGEAFQRKAVSRVPSQLWDEVRVARYHNIFGPEGTWCGGREKSPAAMCRKVALAPDGGSIEIWGDGLQTRSFLYIDECIEGTLRLCRSDWTGPVNMGSDEMVSINQLADIVAQIAGKSIQKKHIQGPWESGAAIPIIVLFFRSWAGARASPWRLA